MKTQKLMQLGLLILLIGIFPLLIAAQGTRTQPIKKQTTSLSKAPDVYLAGATYNNLTQKHTAKYWKNGQAVALTDGSKDAMANDIVVQGNSVYVAGFDDGQAVYWKDGKKFQLTGGEKHFGHAYSIAVSGNDVYVAGYERIYINQTGYRDRARYWKNGQSHTLPADDGYASAHYIIVHPSGDVLAVGTEGGKIHYWKNGQLVEAIKSNLNFGYAIFGTKDDVYIVGATFKPGESVKQVAYWKGNGGTTVLSNARFDALGTDIAVDEDGNVHVVGYEDWRPTYWKNGNATKLAGQLSSPGWHRLALDGKDVYVAGNGDNGGQYWKNGESIFLPKIQDSFYVIKDIAVVGQRRQGTLTQLPKPQKQEVLPNKQTTLTVKEQGELFLAENKKRPGVITTASGLQYEIIKTGNGNRPSANSDISVHYKGTLIDGTEFSNSITDRVPLKMPLKNGIAGWIEGLQLMSVGSKYRFFVPSQLAYGDVPVGDKIKAGSTLIFEIELLSVQ